MVLRRPFFLLFFACSLWSFSPAARSLAADVNLSAQTAASQEDDAEAPMGESRLQMPSTPQQTGARPAAEKESVPGNDQGDAVPAEAKNAAAPGDNEKASIPGDNEDYGLTTLGASLDPGGMLEKGKEESFLLRLTDHDGKAVTDAGLEERHTRKIHLLVVDESLTDYQHVHPAFLKKQGAFGFSFTPKTAHNYFLWADVQPSGGKPQLVFMFLQGARPCKTDCVDKAAGLKARAGSYKGVLALEKGGARAGAPVQAVLTLTGPGGKPVTTLEPVMGAWAHVAAFTALPYAVAHVHPLGAAPSGGEDLGVSPLSFMLHPQRPGFLKIFVQVRLGGKDVFLPFGVTVAE